LERRGIEVDHNLYPDGENREEMTPLSESSEPVERPAVVASTPARSTPPVDTGRLTAMESDVGQLKDELADLREQVSELRDEVAALRRQVGA
jgi:hypothetical protein